MPSDELFINNQMALAFRFKFWTVIIDTMKISTLPPLLFLLILLIPMSGCDNGSSSDGGSGEQAATEVQVIGPNLNGNTWAGYIKNTKGRYDPIGAVIRQSGDRVTIQSSIQSGIGSLLTGTIDSRGRMTMTDHYDNEVWTTVGRSASKSYIKLEDYVFNEKHQRSDINTIVLKR